MKGNIKFKELFLKYVEDNYGSESLSDYNVLFGDSRLGFWENIYGNKDIYDFSTEELLNAYRGFGASKLSSLRSSHSLINKYVLFAHNQKMSMLPTPSTQNINTQDLRDCLNKRKLYGKYITRREYQKMIMQFRNSQDRALFILIFNKGIMGKDFSDIIDLQKEDFDYEQGVLNVKGKYIQLDDIEKELISDAIYENVYDNYTDVRHTTADISASDYIIRPLITRTTKVADGDQIKPSALRIRIKKLAREFGYNDISGTTLYVSGIVNRMLEIQDEWTHKEILEYINENSLKLNAFDTKDILAVIKEKIKNEQG